MPQQNAREFQEVLLQIGNREQLLLLLHIEDHKADQRGSQVPVVKRCQTWLQRALRMITVFL
jgi:hypothetical protein